MSEGSCKGLGIIWMVDLEHIILCFSCSQAMQKIQGFWEFFGTILSLSDVWTGLGCFYTNEENTQDDEDECDEDECDEDECDVIYIRFLTHSCLTLPSFGYWSLALNNKIGKGNCRYQNLNHKT